MPDDTYQQQFDADRARQAQRSEQDRGRQALNAPSTEEETFVLEIAEKAAAKLNKLIEQGHDTSAFTIAIILAYLKDFMDIILDLTLIGLIPILGQLFGLFVSATLMYFLWGKGWFNTTKVKIILWVFGIFFDNLPILNFAPITVLTVLMAWHVVRKKANEAEKKMQELSEKTAEELETIEKEAYA